MKKILAILIIIGFVFVGYSADEIITVGPGYYIGKTLDSLEYDKEPSNLTVYKLYSGGTNASRDTIATTKLNLHGPFALSKSREDPQFAGFAYICEALSGTTPTMAVAYQITVTNKSADIVAANWVYFDTIAATGGDDYISLSGTNNSGVGTGNFLWFYVDNYDGSETQIPDDLWLIFKDAYVYEKKR